MFDERWKPGSTGQWEEGCKKTSKIIIKKESKWRGGGLSFGVKLSTSIGCTIGEEGVKPESDACECGFGDGGIRIFNFFLPLYKNYLIGISH